MKTNYSEYDFAKSRERIDEILNTADNAYEEVDSIPARDKLTFTNGFYVNCSAVFIDIRNSSELPNKYQRPTLSRIYRSFISELVAILNGNSDCSEISIHGDSVWGIFDTPYKEDINIAFGATYTVASLIDTLNCKLKKKSIAPIVVGIGMHYGRALMIKAGYNGSGINDVVWMGDVVNKAAELCGYGNKTLWDCEIMVSSIIYNNLNENNKGLLKWNQTRECWHGNIIHTTMNEWVETNCK